MDHRRRWAGAVVAALGLACAHTAGDAPRLTSQARAEFEQGYTDDALEKMREVTRLTPDDAEAHYVRGGMALRTGRLEEAESSLARATQLAPHHARALAAYGLVMREQRRWADAERALLRSLLIEPGDASTIAALAEVYRLSGDAEKCAARYEQFVWQLERRDAKTIDAREQRALDEARMRAQECEAAALATPGAR
jgi:Flp pilus assembly protein TadD